MLQSSSYTEEEGRRRTGTIYDHELHSLMPYSHVLHHGKRRAYALRCHELNPCVLHGDGAALI